jgi:hypothetical protein
MKKVKITTPDKVVTFAAYQPTESDADGNVYPISMQQILSFQPGTRFEVVEEEIEE